MHEGLSLSMNRGVARQNEARCTLVAVGDVSLGDHPVCAGTGLRWKFEATTGGASSYPFEHLGEVIQDRPDAMFCNLETVAVPWKYNRERLDAAQMCAHPLGLERLRTAGFTAVNVANNHILQHGDSAFWFTVGELNRSGAAVIGLGEGGERAQIVVQELSGVRVAWLGYAFEEDKYWNGRPLYAYGPAIDVVRDIDRARAVADVVVVSAHWGDEFVDCPSPQERVLARRWIESGATVVIGHHPHVIRGYERWGPGVIFYSLGNFVFDMVWDERLRIGLFASLTLSRQRVEDVKIGFARIGDDYQPRALAPGRAVEASRRLTLLNERLSQEMRMDLYQAAVRRAIRRNRYRSWRYFLRQSRQRPLTLTCQQLYGAIQRRVETGLASRPGEPR